MRSIVCFLLFSSLLWSGERGWNSPELAKSYFEHSELQRGWAWELLGQFSFQGFEEVLDFGCGDGKITAEISEIVPLGKVLGVDLSGDMIQLAKVHFPKAAYNNLEFRQTESETFSEISGMYDLIVSFSVFHLVEQPVKVLRHLKEHLRQDGHLLLTIPTNPPSLLRKAGDEYFSKYGLSSPWHYFSYSNKLSMRSMESCLEKLDEAGYKILSIEKIDTPSVFRDKEDLIDWLIGTGSANWGIPFSISRPFFTDVATKMLELDPTVLNEEGCILLPHSRVHVIATHKEESRPR